MSTTKPILKKLPTNKPIDLGSFFGDKKPSSVWVTIIPAEDDNNDYKKAIDDYKNNVNIVGEDKFNLLMKKRGVTL